MLRVGRLQALLALLLVAVVAAGSLVIVLDPSREGRVFSGSPGGRGVGGGAQSGQSAGPAIGRGGAAAGAPAASAGGQETGTGSAVGGVAVPVGPSPERLQEYVAPSPLVPLRQLDSS